MITDLIFILALFPFFMAGVKSPVMAFSGLLIVEILRPQTMTYGILSSLPMSAIGYLSVVTSILINLKKIDIKRSSTPIIILSIWMLWITFTTNNSLFPIQANFLWDSAFKNILAMLFLPLVVRNKNDLNLVLGVVTGCLLYFIVMAGIKASLGGGGYKVDLITVPGGAAAQPLAESSTLSMICALYIPFALYNIKCNTIINGSWILKWSLIISIPLSIMAIVGTAARTGLICLALLSIVLFVYTNRKLLFGLIASVVVTIVIAIAPPEWLERMSTLSSGSEASSGRVAVWKWTVDFVKENPNGGGFYAYIANRDTLHNYLKPGQKLFDMEQGKAFHNAFFQTLGEHGYFGLMVYLSIAGLTTLWALKTRLDKDLRFTLFSAIMVFSAGSMFTGIAYLIWPYLLFTIAYCAKRHDSETIK